MSGDESDLRTMPNPSSHLALRAPSNEKGMVGLPRPSRAIRQRQQLDVVELLEQRQKELAERESSLALWQADLETRREADERLAAELWAGQLRLREESAALRADQRAWRATVAAEREHLEQARRSLEEQSERQQTLEQVDARGAARAGEGRDPFARPTPDESTRPPRLQSLARRESRLARHEAGLRRERARLRSESQRLRSLQRSIDRQRERDRIALGKERQRLNALANEQQQRDAERTRVIQRQQDEIETLRRAIQLSSSRRGIAIDGVHESSFGPPGSQRRQGSDRTSESHAEGLSTIATGLEIVRQRLEKERQTLDRDRLDLVQQRRSLAAAKEMLGRQQEVIEQERRRLSEEGALVRDGLRKLLAARALAELRQAEEDRERRRRDDELARLRGRLDAQRTELDNQRRQWTLRRAEEDEARFAAWESVERRRDQLLLASAELDLVRRELRDERYQIARERHALECLSIRVERGATAGKRERFAALRETMASRRAEESRAQLEERRQWAIQRERLIGERAALGWKQRQCDLKLRSLAIGHERLDEREAKLVREREEWELKEQAWNRERAQLEAVARDLRASVENLAGFHLSAACESREGRAA